jgi:hypothetical protein
MPWRWELYEVEESRTLEELKAKYGDASAKKQSRKKMLDSAEKQYIDIWERTRQLVGKARDCVNLLRKIAARATPLSEIDYLELQIEGEKFRAQAGWQSRVEFLTEILERAKLMKNLVQGDDSAILPAPRVPPSVQFDESRTFLQRLRAKMGLG